MTRKLIGCGIAALGLTGLLALAGAVTVPSGFQVTLLADGLASPKGLDAATYRAGAGHMGKNLMVAESGLNQIVDINRFTGEVEYFAGTMGSFPVGIGCYGGPFGSYMYVGNAMGGGIVRIDELGTVEPFALTNLDIAGLDFGKGQYGKYLYAGEWQVGNIWRVDKFGTPELFATIPFCETRYLQFAQGGPFGHLLYFTDYLTGDVYRVYPDGTWEIFTNLGGPGIEGFAFGPGGAWGHDLYVGNLTTGEIFRVFPDGTYEIWASGFQGVADIIFLPGKRGGFTMYIVDGHSSVFAISLM